jgi:3-oxoacyl-[acyl-carrier protein] reductase
MDLRLLGKRALVTGSSIGLGEAIARALAAEGVAVAIHGRQPKRTYAVAADIEAHGGRVAVVLGDLTVEGEAQNIADSAIEQLGGIDILVNNAGGTGEKLVLMRSRTLSSSCAIRLPVTSPGRTCESMAALYQLC